MVCRTILRVVAMVKVALIVVTVTMVWALAIVGAVFIIRALMGH